MAGERVRVIRPQERSRARDTAERAREEAFASDGLWVGMVRRPPRSFSGWHHHGEHESFAYVVGGSVRLEFGRGGTQHEDARPGDFIFIPKGAVHREGNPFVAPAELVVMLVGSGPSTVEVEGPEGAT